MSFRGGPLPESVRREMLEDLEPILLHHFEPLPVNAVQWSWKEPRCIYLLPFYRSLLPELRFVHVVRDGRDMAFSANQNQLNQHGTALLGSEEQALPVPVRSICLWSRINMLAARYGSEVLGESGYLRLRFEDLCAKPAEVIERVLRFFDLPGDATRYAELVQPPASLGRWREQDQETILQLERDAGPVLREFGYSTTHEQP